MNMPPICTSPECQTTAGCQCRKPWPTFHIASRQSLAVYLPVPYQGMATIAVMDCDGNLRIKTDQPMPDDWA